MATSIRPLLLPQKVEAERQRIDQMYHPNIEEDLFPYSSYTTNSSSSDIVSPVTPTFSTRGHFRGSSSSSSLDLSFSQHQENPASPTQPLTTKQSKRQLLPDVQEEPYEREEERRSANYEDSELYSCLCDEPCEHRNSTGNSLSGEHDINYELGFMSDGDYSSASRSAKPSVDSPFTGLTARFGSRFNTMKRLNTMSRKPSFISSPTAEMSFDQVLSHGPSSRSSSLSSPSQQHANHFYGLPSATPVRSPHGSMDSIESLGELDDATPVDPRLALERDRAKAITPLLPPLMMSPLAQPPAESPLQSPTIAPSSARTEIYQPTAGPNFSRPSISTKPSVSSLRNTTKSSMDLPISLPSIMQQHDEWSDRLGHANFTIMPQPYEIPQVDADAINKFRQDWEAAKVNYTKHIVRTGENYGQTSKIYALTEAKWAETESRWRAAYESATQQTMPANHGYTAAPRSRSRGRARGRSGSASAALNRRPTNDDYFADIQWQRIEDGFPSAVPRMLDEGKFPARGDEDIVGPMYRAVAMERSQSEEKHGVRFWKNLAERVGLRK
ncbi:uncharacterized protein F5Z01DRAFT_476724 [Emericellopsis atlantica]|uniref:Only prolin and serin are matching in the corresponding protein n=1 Tax=Emericellopsis atlantica TaxID=2614577 RepID=A0A9P7ZRU9_9HYPO|nr:uncharacterized protein F5Z01DRAFT_476724 [Emericellopsis atlantica]KAG9256535.1 hypothetical protein F5Z01DRAFT_476724 [Emericellopsis atlantica]